MLVVDDAECDKLDLEASAFTNLAGHLDTAAHLFDDLLADTQP